MNRDAGAMRSSSPTGLRPMGAPTQPTVDGGEGVVNMPRANPAVVAETLRQKKADGSLHHPTGVSVVAVEIRGRVEGGAPIAARAPAADRDAVVAGMGDADA